jgi:hypothetical protein
VKGGQTTAKRAKKNKEQTQQQTVLFSRRFVSEGQGTNQQQRATFGLNLKGGWRPFQPRKKKIRRRASLLLRYSWTRKRRRQHTQQEEEEESISPSHASNTQERRACE